MPGVDRPVDPRLRRRYVAAAVAMVAAIIGLALAAGYLADDPPPVPADEVGDDPHIIPRPGTGKAPERPGDRGGWGQLLVLGVVIGGVATVGLLAWRSSVRARARAAGRQGPIGSGADGGQGRGRPGRGVPTRRGVRGPP